MQLLQGTGRVVSLSPQLLSRSVFVRESERLSPSLGGMNMGRGGWVGVRLVSGCSFPFPFPPKACARAGATSLQASGKDSPRSTSYQEEGKNHGRANALLISLPTQLGCPFLSTWQCSFSGRTMPSPLMGTVGGRETTTAYLGEKGAGGKQGPGSFG